MEYSPRTIRKYLERHAQLRPLLGRVLPRPLSGAVIIPALAEADALPVTLESLRNTGSPEILDSTLIVVVVNNGPPCSDPVDEEVRRQHLVENTRTLAWLQAYADQHQHLNLTWVDAATSGRELPRGTGVGMARKIGSDCVLNRVYGQGDPGVEACPDAFHLYHLDADTSVEENYLAAVSAGLNSGDCHAAVAGYAHQMPSSPDHQTAIAGYELFLRYYVQGLAAAGSPYAFHTIGSTMACTATAYFKVQGIPCKRTAGEDFYFLQNLAKAGRICTVGSTTVHPSARLSQRVPFGTGPRLRQLLAEGADTVRVYAPATFAVLKDLFTQIVSHPEAAAETILQRLDSPAAGEFLRRQGFVGVWPKLQEQHAGTRRVAAFHCWFDALATVRLIRRLSVEEHPEIPLLDGWRHLQPELSEIADAGLVALLERVRNQQRTWPIAGLGPNPR